MNANNKPNTHWTQLKVTCSHDELDRVSAVVGMLDSGLMIEDYSDIGTGFNAVYGELIDEAILAADPNKAAVSIFIPAEKNYNDYAAFIRERFSALGIKASMEFIGVDEEDWAEAWKQYYKPIKIGKKLVVVPMWEKYESEPDEVTLLMDPGMAFGTGTHETTRLCAQLIETHMPKNARVLDIGTGSGILAIAASKLGASEIFACDIDPVAVRVARENIRENNVMNVKCGVSDLLRDADMSGGLYDFACANIVADIVIRLSKDIGRYLKRGGIIVTSGIIETSADDVIEAMTKNGFALTDALSENDWKAFAFTNIQR